MDKAPKVEFAEPDYTPRWEGLQFMGKTGNGALNVYVDQASHRTYYEIIESPGMQMLVSRVLAGIVPVCRITRVVDTDSDAHYLSTHEFFDRDDQSTNNSLVDRLVLRSVFGDSDHKESQKSPPYNRITENSFARYYDFHFANFVLWHDNWLGEKAFDEERYTTENLDAARQKIVQIRDRVRGEAGLDFLKSSWKPSAEEEKLNKPDIVEIHQRVNVRIEAVLEAIDNRLKDISD